MADEVIVKYEADITGLKKAEQELAKVNDMVIGIQNETKEAFSGKQIDAATEKLQKFNNEAGETVQVFESAKQELASLTKQITSNQLEGAALKKAKDRAAELTDEISDARNEIRRMASDTRLFDTVVEGVRGVTAAFAVAQGAAALFGEEGEEMNKTLAKVQGALAFLQGAQELATIATEQGGIATKAAAVAQEAYAIVVGQSTGALKVFKLALAATGIGAVILGLGFLASAFSEAGDEAEEAAKKAEEAAEAFARAEQIRLEKATGRKLLNQQKQDLEEFKSIEEGRVVLQQKTQAESLADQRKYLMERLKAFGEENAMAQAAGIGNTQARRFLLEELRKIEAEITKLVRESELAEFNALGGDIADITLAELTLKTNEEIFLELIESKQNAQQALNDEPLLVLTPEQVKANEEALKKVENATENMIVGIRVAFDKDTPTIKEQVEKIVKEIASNLQQLQPLINELFNIGGAILEGQVQDISQARQREMAQLDADIERQLLAAGNNEKMKTAIKEQEAKKREDIEKRAAKKEAQIRRQQAVLDKALGLFNVAVNTAVGIAKAIPNPVAIALAAITGAAQAAVIAARPLPPVPEFAEGGLVPLMGGDIRNGHITGRRHNAGGVLISAEGGEFINNRQSTRHYKDVLEAANEMRLEDFIMHKYVAPALKAARNNEIDSSSYDDRGLQKTVRESEMASAKYIVTQLKPYLGNGFSGDGKWRAA